MQEDGASSGLAAALPSGRRIEIGRGFDAHTFGAVARRAGAALACRLGAATRIYLAGGATDMRKGLRRPLRSGTRPAAGDPLSGHVFLFAPRAKESPELRVWDGSGLWVCAKRLEKGRFRLAGVRERAGQGGTQPRELALAVRGHRPRAQTNAGDGIEQ